LIPLRSPRRTLPRIEDYFNRKGLVNEHGKKKKAFFVLQKFYREVQTGFAPSETHSSGSWLAP